MYLHYRAKKEKSQGRRQTSTKRAKKRSDKHELQRRNPADGGGNSAGEGAEEDIQICAHGVRKPEAAGGGERKMKKSAEKEKLLALLEEMCELDIRRIYRYAMILKEMRKKE